jgi:signal transduction histidine kinase
VTSVDFLAGGGELGQRIRDFDWSQTPLGPVEDWPQGLRIAARIMLTSRQPIWIGWGPELTYLYNDPYKAIIGDKHPHMLGQPTEVVWSEIWDVISPMLATALTGVEGTYVESQRLIMERYGYREETYYTFSYSPIPADDGSAGGIICANTDDTQRVIGERQLALLRDLAAGTAEIGTAEEVCERSAGALASNQLDLPFALIYLAEPDGETLTLAATSGIAATDPAVHPVVRRGDTTGSRVPLAFGQREIIVLGDVADALPAGAWEDPSSHVALVPLAGGGQAGRGGVLAVGLNPFRVFDSGYRDFLGLVGGQISASIAAAQAYEEERRRAEALAELDRAKTVFFSNVSHEFRTPLTLMLGPLDDLLRDDGLGRGQRDTLEVVRRNALRLLRMVNTVLDFSRASAGRTTGDFRPTDLSALTAELVGRFGALVERGGVAFSAVCDDLGEPVYVDADAWERIVLNLLSNAFKFTLDGEIAVTLRRDGDTDGALLVVRDTGTGIPESELPHLFERFHRVRNDQARTQEGTGIGLALVRELVELHGGTIAVESTVGRGTTFTVTIPFGAAHLPTEELHEGERASSSAQTALAYIEEASRWIGVEDPDAVGAAPRDALETGTPGDERVAVVDDNADMRDYLAGLLGHHWQVETYADGEAARTGILSDPPDLVITDVMMPRLDGFGLVAALRADSRTAALPVIVVSARAGEESSVEGLDAGADDYLVKPFSARELVARVRVNLDLARARAEAGRLAALEDVRARVITTVSHELRTPVSAIYGAARTLERFDDIDEGVRGQLLDVIGAESARLARITDDILTTESLASGIVTLTPEPLDAREAVASAVTAAAARSPHELQIRTEMPDEEVRLEADPGRLQQVLTNLLDNALKYSTRDTEVAVRLVRDNGTVRIAVEDTGIGIPEDAREQIFQRFYRVDPYLTGGVGGSGLGLYICREIVEAMGGSIRHEPNDPRGSRFVVSLPAA